VLLQVDVADDVPAIATIRFSVPASPGVPTRKADGDPRPKALAFGYYMADVSGQVTIRAQALDSGGCVVGQGEQTVDGVVPGQTRGPASLSMMKAAATACGDGGVDHAQGDAPASSADRPALDGGGDAGEGDGAVDGPPKRARGAACTQDTDCALGHCVDGVCCESACAGSCEACAEPDQKGSCVAVTGSPRGTRAACAGAGTACAGSCGGVNRSACVYPDQTTSCGSARCQGGMGASAPTCDGAGQCRSVTPVPCASGQCLDAAHCAGGCSNGGAACSNGQFCNGAGACQSKIAAGGACDSDTSCQSGSCVDGHCCTMTACGPCQACSGSGGTCVSISNADDPDTCAGDRTCSASGVCKTKPGGTCTASVDCAGGSCVDGHCCMTASCAACQACTGGGGACVSVTGAEDPDTCSGTRTCDAAGVCKAKQGQPCNANGDCLTAHCADGVCCESACAGQCESCGEPNNKGSCVAVTGAPRTGHTACTGTGACLGTCDGSSRNACAFPVAGTACGAPSCVNGMTTSAPTCDGAGSCRPGLVATCSSNQCTDSMRCSGSCDPASSPCAASQFCNAGGACQTKNPDGNACAQDVECTSGHCVDGRCCGIATCGTCQVCTGANGTCVAVTGADDPDSCTNTRTCTAAGTCTAKPGNACSVGSDCSTGHCVDGRCCTTALCGICQACLGAGGTCVPVVAADDPDTCTGSRTCDTFGAACRTKLGQSCTGDEDCISGHCTDGVCCESACSGRCEACAETGQAGKCVAVGGTPRGVRLPCPGTGTACGGICDGTNRTVCVYPGPLAICGSPSCTNGIATTAPICDQAGGCRVGTSVVCPSNLCASPTMCSGACDAVTAPCPDTQYCNGAGVCQTKLSNGVVCVNDGMCTSGHCIDGRCCGSSACGTCQSCTGAAGTCVSVAGMDDDSCNGTKTCDANGTCRNKSGQTCLAAMDCASGSCVDGRCCTVGTCGSCQTCTGGGGICVAVLSADDLDTCTGTQTCDATGVCKPK